ncbi:MAG: DUF4465 domain-containing protein [Betaproteobacteria bacterium]|nr:DUF4465 domain-containing protein [Betaproteobacteria bacterium]
MKISHFVAAIAAFLVTGSAVAETIGFEDFALDATGVYMPGATTSFTSGSATFNHEFENWGGGCCWSGWTVSNHTDSTTAGPANQYSAWPGSGEGGSAQYGIAYVGAPSIDFASPVVVQGASLAVTTYTALSMLQGDGFAKKFGGPSGTDPDFLTVAVQGRDVAGHITGTVVLALADYRFDDSGSDFILEGWQRIDLTSLGMVSSLSFSMDSSDKGDFGINTPTYFALDDLTVTAVPEPGTAALLTLGVVILAAGVSRRR